MLRHLIATALLLAPIAAVHGQGQLTTQADGTLALAHEVIVDAPAAEVWTAISTPEGWRGWAVPAAWRDPADPNVLETSYDPAARPGQPQTIQQRFMDAVPGRSLAFRTIKAPAGFPDFETFSRVVSRFELIADGDRRTRVRLTMTGYPDNETGRRLAGFFNQGNALSLDRLQRRFRDGPLDWPSEFRRVQPAR